MERCPTEASCGGTQPATGATPSRARRQRSRGVAMVEFALVFPLLAVLLLGMVDLGRAYSLQNRLRNAAREGALYLQTHPLQQVEGATLCADPDNAEDHALSELSAAADSEDSGYTVAFSPSTACGIASTSLEPGDMVTVTVSAQFELITPLIGQIVGSPIQIDESVEVVIQGDEP